MKKTILASLLSLSLVFNLAPVSAAVIDTKQELIVTFKTKMDTTFLVSKGAQIKRVYPSIKGVSVSILASKESDLYKNSDIKSIEHVQTFQAIGQVDDWGIEPTKARVANQLGYTGKGVKVAVLDTGISPHPDLYISGGVSFMSNSSSYTDDNGHGTHVAGIIGAKNNDIGFVGVAPDAEIYAVKVMGANGMGTSDALISGIDWAIANNMDIINMSLGFSSIQGTAVHDAVKRATQSGILVLAAAGNNGNAAGNGDTVKFPARYSETIAVAATDRNSAKAVFSDAGPEVDIAAPGVSISSTSNKNGYVAMSGTSMATPYAAGIVALYKEAYPSYNTTQIRSLVEQNAKDLGPVGKDNLFGYGLIQAPTVKGTAVVPSAPSLPNGIRASEISTTSLKLSWNAESSPTVYELTRAGKLIYIGTSPTFVDTKLAAGTSYAYTLSARNVSGTSQASTFTTYTKPTSLAAPVIKTTAIDDTHITLTLNPVKAARTYTIKRNNTVIYTGESLQFKDQNLSPLQTYTYSVTATDYSGTLTSKETIKVLTTTPSRVKTISEQHDQTSVSLSWDAVSNVDGYIVKDGTKQIYKGPLTTVTQTKLLAGTVHAYSLLTYKGNQISLPTQISVRTTPVAPNIPQITGKTATKDSINVIWKKEYNVDSYALRVNGIEKYKGALSSYKITGLTPGTVYNIELIATNEVDSKQTSVSVKTIPNAPAAAPVITVSSDILSQNVSWTTVPGATYYIVKKDGKQVYKGSLLEFNVTKLLPNKNYTYEVIAGNEGGVSAQVAKISKSTLQQMDPIFSIHAPTAATKGVAASLSGTIKLSNGSPVALTNMTITMTKPGNVKQVIAVKTDVNGNFTYNFIPVKASVSGTYVFEFKVTSNLTTSYKTGNSIKNIVVS